MRKREREGEKEREEGEGDGGKRREEGKQQMMIDPGKLPLGRKSNNSSNREQEQGKRERGVPKNSTDTLTQQEKRVLLRFLFFFFSFFVGFLLCCTDGEEIAPFPFFQFFACLYAVTTCRNQKRAKSEKTKKQNQNPTETTLQRISFESNKKKRPLEGLGEKE